jgi:hypothetical protein
VDVAGKFGQVLAAYCTTEILELWSGGRFAMSKINRRNFLNGSAKATLALGIPIDITKKLSDLPEKGPRRVEEASALSAEPPDAVLPGTTPLTMHGDLAIQMVDGIHRYLLSRIAEASKERGKLWKRDYRSLEAYK